MGLLGMMARTAVVAGTATAVSGRVSRRQQARYQQKADAQAYQEQQAAPAQEAEPQYQQPQYQQPQYQQPPPGYQQPQYQQPQYPPPPPGYQQPQNVGDAPAPAGEPNLVEEIKRLASLKDQGILSEDEFAAAKSKLLGI
jgi:hypothetical protein